MYLSFASSCDHNDDRSRTKLCEKTYTHTSTTSQLLGLVNNEHSKEEDHTRQGLGTSEQHFVLSNAKENISLVLCVCVAQPIRSRKQKIDHPISNFCYPSDVEQKSRLGRSFLQQPKSDLICFFRGLRIYTKDQFAHPLDGCPPG